MKRFKIYDWAGNDKSDYYGTFASFEDAWDRLYQEFPNDPEDPNELNLGEFYVEEMRNEI